MSLKIFGTADGSAPPKKSFSDDVVGRFRSGYVANKRPVALTSWRVTTGDPTVADQISAILDGDKAQEWDAAGEDNLEIFTKSTEIKIVLEGTRALRQAMVLYGRKGIIRVSDGETVTYPDDLKGQPDPQAGQTLQERKAAAKDGTGAEPRIEIFFRLAENPDLGIFKFQTGSWSMASDLAYNGTEDELTDLIADNGSATGTLSLEEVSFEAKSGPRAGQTVTYTKPVLKLDEGPAF